jgi:hypothetical protein
MTSSSTIDSSASSISQPLVNFNRIQSPQAVELPPTIPDSSRNSAVRLSTESPREKNQIEKENPNTPPNAKPSMSMMTKFKATVALLVGVGLGFIFAKDGSAVFWLPRLR